MNLNNFEFLAKSYFQIRIFRHFQNHRKYKQILNFPPNGNKFEFFSWPLKTYIFFKKAKMGLYWSKTTQTELKTELKV